MSVRTHFPSAKQPDSHFFFTVARGERQKRFALRPGALYALIGGLPLLGAVYLGATAYLFFRDDMVAALMARQARQQYAYEDRLAAMRLQLDRVTSRQLLDQDSFEGKVQHLIAREAQLDTRESVLEAAELRLESAIKSVQEEKAAIASAENNRVRAKQGEIGALANAYERMKPREAARIFEILDDDILIPVAAGMRMQSLAGVLAEMAPEKARALTVALANRAAQTPAAENAVEGETP